MITGVITDDLDYLVYLMLKDGSYFNRTKKNPMKNVTLTQIAVNEFENWFDELKGIYDEKEGINK